MRQKIHSITQSLRLPSICTLCNQFYKGSTAVCEDCVQFLKPLGTACQRCACPLPDPNYLICGPCIKKPPHFDNTYIAYAFEEPLRGLLHRFKYKNGLYLGTFLSQLILHAVSQHAKIPECLIPVPLHPQRLKQRGFNQAAILTRYLAKALNRPYDLSSCKKIINTLPQAQLDSKQRRKNLHQAFHCKPLNYQHIALIDDLLTTGSTASELARTLKNAGVKQVDVWCCARTLSQN